MQRPMVIIRLVALLTVGCFSASDLVAASTSGETSGDVQHDVHGRDLSSNTDEAPQVRFVFALNAQAPTVHGERPVSNLLHREIVRQGVLIAARDGLGMQTVDAALREPAGTEPWINIETHMIHREAMTFRITRAPAERVFEHHVSLPKGTADDYIELATEMEILSRGALLDALKQAGFKGRPRPEPSNAPVPDDIEALLDEFNFIAQFSAVRRIHQRMAERGESPDLLGALVRAYANLGQLTQFHYTTAFKTFSARAMLYADRLVARDPDSATARWHRAYARAMVGLQNMAIDDLAGYRDHEHPEWVSLINAYCHYAIDDLDDVTDARHDQLAQFLKFLALEYSGSNSLTLETCNAALEVMPDCLRIIDAMNENAGVGYLHTITVMGITTIAETLPRRLAQMPGLPPAARDAVSRLEWSGDPRDIAEVSGALIESGENGADHGEPSWGLLGRLVEEAAFSQTMRRLSFMVYRWNVGPEDEVVRLLPIVERHPYRFIVESFSLHSSDDADRSAFLENVQSMEIVDITVSMRPMLRHGYRFGGGDKNPMHRAWNIQNAYADAIESDVNYNLVHLQNPAYKASLANWLLDISKHAPLRMAVLIENNWPAVENHAEQWETEYGHHARVMAAFARRYSALERYEDAERFLKAYIDVAPDRWAHELLAEIYLKQGNTDDWLRIMKGFLQEEDYALDHAKVRVAIADHFMAIGDFETALPYAVAAAQSWANWAMRCAVQCYEGLGEWADAEVWMRRIAERYASSGLDWYLWCKRTGRGDVAAARRLAEEYLVGIADRGKPYDLEMIAIFNILEGEQRVALQHFMDAHDERSSPYDGLHVALLAEQLGDIAMRDTILTEITELDKEKYKPDQRRLIRLAQLLHKFIIEEEPQPPLDSVEKLRARSSLGGRINIDYFLGRLLALRGHEDEAMYYLTRCATSPGTDKWNCVLANDWLHAERAKTSDQLMVPSNAIP